jgi:lipoate-protein ligase A
MTSRELLVVSDEATEPARNLAREEGIFGSVERRELPEVLRFWRNAECLIRGRVRNPKYGWYDEALAASMGVPVYERSTGGGVVYQDLGNLNWTFFLHASGSIIAPTTLFDRASAHVVEALRQMGFDAGFAPPNRIDVSRRKVSGMAARSTQRAHLVHGTLLIAADLERLNALCMPPQGCPPVSNLAEWSAKSDAEGVKGAILRALQTEYAVRTVDGLQI